MDVIVSEFDQNLSWWIRTGHARCRNVTHAATTSHAQDCTFAMHITYVLIYWIKKKGDSDVTRALPHTNKPWAVSGAAVYMGILGFSNIRVGSQPL